MMAITAIGTFQSSNVQVLLKSTCRGECIAVFIEYAKPVHLEN
jgi:hypothetical protein